jgi:hypothetical protein
MSSMNLILDQLTPVVEGAEMLRKIPPSSWQVLQEGQSVEARM